MATLPKIPEWATLATYPAGPDPWNLGPVRVVPTNAVKQYGNTPNDPAVAQYDNYYKGNMADFATFTRKQHIGHWGAVLKDVTYNEGVVRLPLGLRAAWASLGDDPVSGFNTFFCTAADVDTKSPPQNGPVLSWQHPLYGCNNLAGVVGIFSKPGGVAIQKVNMALGTITTEAPPVTIDASEWNDVHCTPQGSILLGGKGRFAHRDLFGAWTVVTPAGLGTGADQLQWWFYSSPDCPTPNRTWAMNRADQFIYSDDGGLTWSGVTSFPFSSGANETCSRPVWDPGTQKWVFVWSDPSLHVYKIYVASDGLTWSNPAGDGTMALGSMQEFGGVLYGLALIPFTIATPAATENIEIVYSEDGGLTWSQTGKTLCFLGPDPVLGGFPHLGSFFEQNFRISKSSFGLVAVAENVGGAPFHTYTCAMRPYTDSFPSI